MIVDAIFGKRSDRVSCDNCGKHFVPHPYEASVDGGLALLFDCPRCEHTYTIRSFTGEKAEMLETVRAARRELSRVQSEVEQLRKRRKDADASARRSIDEELEEKVEELVDAHDAYTTATEAIHLQSKQQ